MRNTPWDYYPRGRVVLRNEKYTVYAHQEIVTDEALRPLITETFALSSIPADKLRFVTDGAAHYDCAADKKLIKKKGRE